MPFTPPSTVASKANTGYLATLQLQLGSPLAYVPIAELTMVDPEVGTAADVEFTTLLSPSNTEESGPGMVKPGPIQMEGNFIADAQTQLIINTGMQTQRTYLFKLVGSVQQGAETYNLSGANGYFTKYKVGPWEKNKAVKFTATLQPGGVLTESAT